MSCFCVSSPPLLYIVRNTMACISWYMYIPLPFVLLSVVSQCHLVVTSVSPLLVYLYCSLVVNIDSDYHCELGLYHPS